MVSDFSSLSRLNTDKFVFQEQLAIQSLIKAELVALEELSPYLEVNGTFVIPANTARKYRYWSGGQSLEATLRELGATEDTIKKYVPNWLLEEGGCHEK